MTGNVFFIIVWNLIGDQIFLWLELQNSIAYHQTLFQPGSGYETNVLYPCMYHQKSCTLYQFMHTVAVCDLLILPAGV